MFRPAFAPPQAKFTISYEPMNLGDSEDPRPFILCCHPDEFHDLQNGATAFEQINEETYRLILSSTAHETEIDTFKKTINASLKSAASILEHLTRYQAGYSLRPSRSY